MKNIPNKIWSTMPVHKADEDIWIGIENHIKTNRVINNASSPPENNTSPIQNKHLKYIYLTGTALTIGILCYFIFNNHKAIDKVSTNVIKQNPALVNAVKNDTKPIINRQNNTGTKANNTISNELSNGLLAYYPCNGNALDLSGNNNNGTLHGTTDTTDRFNLPNKALLFKGNGEYIEVPHDIWSNNLTLSAWIYADDFGSISKETSGKAIFFKAPNTGSNVDYILTVGYDKNMNAKVSFNFGQGSSRYKALFSKSVLEINQWYLITVTRENGVAKIYINGKLDATTTYAFTPVNQHYNLKLGMTHFAEQSFSGKLDELRIYNRALSDREINNLYHEGKYY